MYVQYNPNPLQKSTGDCVIRALCKLLDKTWDEVYIDLTLYGYKLKDWGSSNAVWNEYLFDKGYEMYPISNMCPRCYTVADFCRNISSKDNNKYLLATGTHVVTVIGKDYYDSWDSGNEIPIYYYKKIER